MLLVKGEWILNKYTAKQLDCRTFQPERPLSALYKTSLFIVDEGLQACTQWMNPMRPKHPAIKLLVILLHIC